MPKKSYNQILDEHLHILIAQGNHEAYNTLRKRYHVHASILVSELLKQYAYTGISSNELITVCEEHFVFVISKYVPGRSSFYSFWKSSSSQYLMDYLVDHSYNADAYVFKGSISFDQKNDEMHSFSELLAERGDEKAFKRKIFEIRHTLHKFDAFFTASEKTLLNLILDGYSLADFEHTGVLGRSQINLTYKSAVEKLQKYMKVSH